MWGYSGGSLATEWAAELQPTYAPELNFAAAAVGGLVPNITSVLDTINEGPFAGLAPAGILGLTSAYPELATFVDENLVPSKAAEFKDALTQCINGDILQYVFQDVYTYFINGAPTLLEPGLQAILSAAGIQGTHGTPKMPLFFYKAVGDEISPAADTDALVEKLCSQGAQIQYVTDRLREHVTKAITGAGGALVFLKDGFDGVPASTGCNTTDVSLNPAAIKAFGLTVADALFAILALPIGEMGFL